MKCPQEPTCSSPIAAVNPSSRLSGRNIARSSSPWMATTRFGSGVSRCGYRSSLLAILVSLFPWSPRWPLRLSLLLCAVLGIIGCRSSGSQQPSTAPTASLVRPPLPNSGLASRGQVLGKIPRSQIPDPRPQAPHAKPQTLNPKPQTPDFVELAANGSAGPLHLSTSTDLAHWTTLARLPATATVRIRDYDVSAHKFFKLTP